MESGLLTEGTCANLQGRLDYSHWVLEEAETQEGAVWVAKGKAWEPTSVPLQVVIAASQIQWTADVTKCLMTAKERSDKKILKVMKKKQVGSPSRMGPTWSWNWCVGGVTRIRTGESWFEQARTREPGTAGSCGGVQQSPALLCRCWIVGL